MYHTVDYSNEMLASLYNERGFTKYLYVDFNGAIEDYTKALDLYQSATYYYNRGLIHYRLGVYYIWLLYNLVNFKGNRNEYDHAG